MLARLGIVNPQLEPIAHPMKRMSEDEMLGRSLCDIQDPNATFPSHCSACRCPGTHANPLRLVPIDRAPKALARAYLYRSICRTCTEQGVR